MAYINDTKYYVFRGGGDDTAIEDCIYIKDKVTQKTLAIPVSLFDELVAMRHPQLVEGMGLEKVQYRTYKKHAGNTGVDALARVLGKPVTNINMASVGGIKKKDV